MYETHFGFRELPFTITPDTSFFLAQASHHEALNTLLVAARSGEGFIKVIGEVGTGKTLLCRKFLASLAAADFLSAYILNPYLEPLTLLRAIADELHVNVESRSDQHQLLKALTKFLAESYTGGRRVILCLDEVQAMPLETLESLRLLTNLETERRKLLQVVLFGQPELDARLAAPSIRQLRQRISFTCQLRPLTLPEVDYYLAHRLSVAGYRGPRLFTESAVRLLHRCAAGIPRLLNILAHKALMASFGLGLPIVDIEHVRIAAADTESVANRGHRHRWLPSWLNSQRPSA